MVLTMLLIALTIGSVTGAELTVDGAKPVELNLIQKAQVVGKLPAELMEEDWEGRQTYMKARSLPDLDMNVVLDGLFVAVAVATGIRCFQSMSQGASRVAAQKKYTDMSQQKHGESDAATVTTAMAASEEKKRKVNKFQEFHTAVLAEDMATCEELLKQKLVKVDERDVWLCTPLHIAANGGSATMVSWLLNKGANVDATEACDQTPLHLAACMGHLEVCEELLNWKACINATDAQEKTPLILAGKANHPEVAKLLLSKGASLGESVREEDVPPLLNNLLLLNMLERSFAEED